MSNDTFPDLVPGTYKLDPMHTEIGFVVRHIVTKVRGRFTEFDGEIVIAENPAESRATAHIDLSSVETGVKQRDDHLRSSDFFDVDNSPEMTFETTGLRFDRGTVFADGTLTIRGVTKPVSLDVEYGGTGVDPYGNTKLGLEARGEISRKEWGVSFNIPLEGDKVVIGDRVVINLTVEADLQKEQSAANEQSAAA
jgi:polyisoprenoid-binding protein YceI